MIKISPRTRQNVASIICSEGHEIGSMGTLFLVRDLRMRFSGLTPIRFVELL